MTPDRREASVISPRFAPMWAGALVLLVACLVLVGWALDITTLKSVLPGWKAMKANNAVSFVLIGLALLSLSAPLSLARRLPAGFGTYFARGCALLAGLIGLLTLGEYVSGLSFGIDQWLFREAVGAVDTSDPGRMAPDAALSFVLLGMALFLASGPGKTRWPSFASVILSLVVMTLALEVIVSFFAANAGDYGRWGVTIMAANAAALFVVSGMGVTAIALRRSFLDWSLGRRTVATFVLGLVILLFVGIIASRTMIQLRWTDRQTALADRVVDVSSHVLEEVSRAQTSTRGFVITRETSSEDGYISAADSSRAALAVLRALTVDSPERLKQVTRLGAQVDTALAWWKNSIDTRRSGVADAVVQRAMTDRGENLMNAIRVTITRFQDQERQLLETRRRQTTAGARFSQVIIGAGTLIGLVTLVTVFLGLNRAVTNQTRAEEALRSSNEYLENLFTYANAPIIVWNPQLRITRFNPAFESLSGRKASDVIGEPLEILFPPARAPVLMELIRKTLAGERWETAEIDILRTDGAARTLLWKSANVFGVDGTTPVATIAQGTDVTEHRVAEERLQRTLADLERSNKDLYQFAYVASHDLQEPLRMVSSYTQLLAQRYEAQLDERAKKYIAYAVDGAVRMQRLINDLLTYSRVSTRGKPLEMTDTHAVLGEAIANLGAAIAESGAMVTNDDLPVLFTDASQLVLVFQNLISNAIKFRGDVSPRVHVSAKSLGNECLFSVRDNGIGIDRQYADRVFVIFQRLHTRQAYPGTGIGLALCKRIVERHAGRIWFESEPGAGTTFFFTLPQRQGGQDALDTNSQTD